MTEAEFGREASEKKGAQLFELGIFLLIVGAILHFAVTATVSGVDLATVGNILLVAGGLCVLWAVVVGRRFWSRRDV